ncbi:MAG: hypothetical protein ABSA53_10410 [Streptosporangiaceae bacterium]|jgi:hypothetical protein
MAMKLLLTPEAVGQPLHAIGQDIPITGNPQTRQLADLATG